MGGEGDGVGELFDIGQVQIAPVEGVRDVLFGYPDEAIPRFGFQYFWRRRERKSPNCITLGANDLSVEAFTDGVMSSGSLLDMQINRSLRLIWYNETRL